MTPIDLKDPALRGPGTDPRGSGEADGLTSLASRLLAMGSSLGVVVPAGMFAVVSTVVVAVVAGRECGVHYGLVAIVVALVATLADSVSNAIRGR